MTIKFREKFFGGFFNNWGLLEFRQNGKKVADNTYRGFILMDTDLCAADHSITNLLIQNMWGFSLNLNITDILYKISFLKKNKSRAFHGFGRKPLLEPNFNINLLIYKIVFK